MISIQGLSKRYGSNRRPPPYTATSTSARYRG